MHFFLQLHQIRQSQRIIPPYDDFGVKMFAAVGNFYYLCRRDNRG